MTETLNLSDFDYYLPQELIAQYPAEKRDTSKMMVLHPKSKDVEHLSFKNFPDLLNEGDVLVLNNTKVIPARLIGRKETGAVIEVLLLHSVQDFTLSDGIVPKNVWSALIRNSKRLKTGDNIVVSKELSVKLLKKGASNEDGPPENTVELVFEGDDVYKLLEKYGKIPLPPYISRDDNENDKKTYQTVFAKIPGSVAAPTAGLHFTPETLDIIRKKGVKIAYITLNVGLGTFLPVKCDNILEHKMHTESFEITEETAKIINDVKNSGKGKIIAVGTTVARALEAAHKKHGKILPVREETDIFIYPPYQFKVVDKLLTNFHLPKSTLVMLVSALAGKDFTLEAYALAVQNRYRFFSYGDCMFIG